MLQVKVVSSLEKIFPRSRCEAPEITAIEGGRGEVVAFQLAFFSDENPCVAVAPESDCPDWLSIREVGLIPCVMPAMPDDDFVLTHEPGLFPDPLLPIDAYVRAIRNNWAALWVTVTIPPDAPPGRHRLRFHFTQYRQPIWQAADFNVTAEVELNVLDFALPPQKLLVANWFHADCLKEYYRLDCWSQAHWAMLEKYFRNLAEHGGNVLLTPLWTLPLDTAVGGERPTVQLLEIRRRGGVYQFDFTRLERWIDTARRCGITHFEMSHFFTQWGAGYTPKIEIEDEHGRHSPFGWQTPADAPEYRELLAALLPELTGFLCRKGLAGKCIFHVSDEPLPDQAENYARARALVAPYLDDAQFPIMDALSSVEFFRRGILPHPIPDTEVLLDFLREEPTPRWVYYCGNYRHQVPNRQFGMPSMRNRVLGVMLYLHRIEGFLNWGYNFWFTQGSLRTQLNPFLTPEAGRAFCGGGSYNVYPGESGPLDSLHFEVFREALQDLRALELLESQLGREAVLAILQEGVPYPLNLHNYPRSAAWLLGLRRRINARLVSA